MNRLEPLNGRAAPARVELMTIKDVAQLLGFTPRTVWRWVKEGIFPPPLRFGTSRRWRRADVERIAREGLPPAAG